MEKILHVYNRGVDKRVVFTCGKEYSYFVHLLYVLNDRKSSINTRRDLERGMDRDPISIHTSKKRERLVDILAFVLMPNHYHLLLSEKVEDGISKFMQKIGIGYTMYFNEKYRRSGSLFQGKYKRVLIESNSQLLYIPHYIHLNPTTLTEESDKNKLYDFLLEYKWSSFPDYVGEKNFPSVTHRKPVLDIFGSEGKYKKDIRTLLSKNEPFSQKDPSDLIDLNI